MSTPRRLSVCPLLLVLLLFSGSSLLLGCESSRQDASIGEWPPPAPSHYRDFETADRLSAYLRSDALPLISAHRGGPAKDFPENALATFAHSLTHGPVLLETDVRMTEDSVLVLIHDETLGRTTTGSGPVRDRTLSEVRKLRLVTDAGDTTRYQVPTAAEVLAWAEGRAVIQLDVKEDVPRTLVTDLLRRMDALDQALVITYALEDARWYHRQMPNLLLSVSAETREAAMAHLEQIDPARLVAFAGVGTPSEEVLDVFSDRNVPVTAGTFGDLDRQARQRGLVVYRDLFRQGVNIIATDETALASQAADTYRPQSTSEPMP